MNKMRALIQDELRLRAGGPSPYVAFGFFVLAGVLAPFSLGPDPELLARIAPGYVWLIAAISVLVGLEGLFQEDIASGRMAVLRLSGLPSWAIALSTMSVYWLVVCLPVVIASLPVSYLLSGTGDAALAIAVSLLIGTPALAMLGATLAAIAGVVKRGTGLVIFLALPFFAPALIFGTRLAGAAEDALSAGLFLAAFSLQAVALCPLLAGLAIRQNME
ncbi:heme exporter protein CcmB [Aquisalinus flavus]|uniref:Heme exporter protein B n=1 Tax=Aquisalinus flavus TaxID=1526572 RepID=A0A8J2Y5I8_9PROT|nr:heme exporter protein CcmB [Aquisalinus flavus]MBD0425727.1 heme exporter protein CcmB [Aquisalinus flavus]UNE48664.1 heme exporter protein CcmB [Aquisalinus flavus]GGD13753.1 heme exporter protein B [Aquisalinus flavus]